MFTVQVKCSPSDWTTHSHHDTYRDAADQADMVHGRVVPADGTAVVEVDMEFNADKFWVALAEHYPALAESLREEDYAVIDQATWDAVQQLPGFADGPDYARTALRQVV